MEKFKKLFRRKGVDGRPDFNNSQNSISQDMTKDTEPAYKTEHAQDPTPVYDSPDQIPTLFTILKKSQLANHLEAIPGRFQQIIMDENYRLHPKLKETILYVANLIILPILVSRASSTIEFMGYRNSGGDVDMEDDAREIKNRLEELFKTESRDRARKLIESWPGPLPAILEETKKRFDVLQSTAKESTPLIAHNHFLSFVRDQHSIYHCGWKTSEINTTLEVLYKEAQANGRRQELHLNSLCFTLERILNSIKVRKQLHQPTNIIVISGSTLHESEIHKLRKLMKSVTEDLPANFKFEFSIVVIACFHNDAQSTKGHRRLDDNMAGHRDVYDSISIPSDIRFGGPGDNFYGKVFNSHEAHWDKMDDKGDHIVNHTRAKTLCAENANKTTIFTIPTISSLQTFMGLE